MGFSKNVWLEVHFSIWELPCRWPIVGCSRVGSRLVSGGHGEDSRFAQGRSGVGRRQVQVLGCRL